jgi:hypothetical protein
MKRFVLARAVTGRRLACCLGAIAALCAGVLLQGANDARAQQAVRGRDFRPRRLMGVQPAIVNPPAIAAQQVRGQVTDTELVLGVVVEGQARAYPINMLTGPQREIINDVLGGRAIAATW